MERAELKKLLRATGCAESAGDFVFLCDPKWGAAERKQADACKTAARKQLDEVSRGWLCIPTGGTSGAVKFARHDEQTLAAAVEGFCQHFGLKRVNALDVLPPFHVSGLMARVRCAATGGKHRPWDWKKLEAGELPRLGKLEDGWVISLVPTQLQRLLTVQKTRAWLRQFRLIFIGGGPVWPALLKAAVACQLPLSLSYGMTETAAMIAASLPQADNPDATSDLRVLPHGQVEIHDGNTHRALPAWAEGLIAISAGSLFRGYFGEAEKEGFFETSDLGRLDERGCLHVLGRRDAVIITGGEKVSPLEVESVLRTVGGFTDVAVIGVPDPQWGQVVVACYPEAQAKPSVELAKRALIGALAPHKHPKRYQSITPWPVNAQGKVNRTALLAAVSDSVHPRG